MNVSEFDEEVYDLVRCVPEGKVIRYGDIADALGKKCARAVGNSLRKSPYSSVPCHRVVNAEGRLAARFGPDGSEAQKRALEREGVEVSGDRVDLDKYLFEL